MTVAKPEKTHRVAASFDWLEIEDYVRQRYGRELRDWNGKYRNREVKHEPNTEVAYLDFWHWICDNHEIHNGCFFTLSLSDQARSTGQDGNAPRGPRCRCAHCFKSDAPECEEGWEGHQTAFVREVLGLLNNEFPEENGELHVYVRW